MKLRIKDWKLHFESAESRKLKALKWVAMPNGMNTQGYTSLLDHPNGAAHFGAWCAIVEICSARQPQERRGTLPEGDGTLEGIARCLARMSRISQTIFDELLPRLIDDPEIQWIEPFTGVPGESAGTSGESAGIPGIQRTTADDSGTDDRTANNSGDSGRNDNPLDDRRTTQCDCGEYHEGSARLRCNCGRVHDPTNAPDVDPIEATRSLLSGYVQACGLQWPDPDTAICVRTLSAAGGVVPLVLQLRHLLLDRKKKPRSSYGWFPLVVGGSRRPA